MPPAKKKAASAKPPWRKTNPKAKSKTSRKLTPSQKAAAKTRAAKAGRPYPNMVDNMAVAKEANAASKTKRKTTARKK